jgi:S-adenosylmethionine hydrolase
LKLVTLTTDFGLRDPYVAEMKAVMLGINSDLRIVDISHQIDRFDVRMGSFVLASAAKFFPPGTIHVGVVDPGVGTPRRPILIETRRGYYVGPDNGLLTLAAQQDGLVRTYHITNPKLMLPQISHTFHGRDIFAPVAAYLSRGVLPFEFGEQIVDLASLTFGEPKLLKGKVVGEILHVDNFGNLTTNIPLSALDSLGVKRSTLLRVKVGAVRRTLVVAGSYAEIPRRKALLIEGSTGLLEISVNQGNAARLFRGKTGSKVEFSRV